jgi:hypothetical protein
MAKFFPLFLLINGTNGCPELISSSFAGKSEASDGKTLSKFYVDRKKVQARMHEDTK